MPTPQGTQPKLRKKPMNFVRLIKTDAMRENRHVQSAADTRTTEDYTESIQQILLWILGLQTHRTITQYMIRDIQQALTEHRGDHLIAFDRLA